MIGARLTTVMLFLIAGGLVMTASRFKSSSQQQDLIALDLIDLFNQEQTDLSTNPEGYNYCQAPRPTLETYPDPKVEGATLIHSQLFIRHGDRAPISALPLDLDMVWDCSSAYTFTGPRDESTEKSPYHYANVVAHQVVTIPAGSPFASKLMWKGSCAPGQLTPLGALQHRKLGAALRQIYVDKLNLLPEIYDADTVHIRSTDVWRTKQSAENLMAGMYGVQGKSKSATHPTLPILQIHTLPTEVDYLTLNAGACPRISQLRSNIEKTSEVLKQLKDDNVDFSKQLTRILGVEKPWSGYMDTILPRICHNKPLQCREDGIERGWNCINESISNRVLDNVAIQTTEMYRDAEGVFDVLRLGMGPLASEIKDNLLAAKAQGRVRLNFYSGHDTTVLPLLGLFGAEDMRWPPYASSILVELWKTPQGEHFVRVLYNQAVLLTKHNWCNLEWCPLEAFVTHLDRFHTKDLMSECQRQ